MSRRSRADRGGRFRLTTFDDLVAELVDDVVPGGGRGLNVGCGWDIRPGDGRFLLWDWVLEPVVNVGPRAQDLYEMTAISRLFPAANVLVALRK